MNQIDSTLLKFLFSKPTVPIGNAPVSEAFYKLYVRIFPNEDDFICFLTSQNDDEKYEYAEKILHRLCFESNFPPTYYSLLDIAAVEYAQKSHVTKNDSYIPRDHFIHVVYLYLRGIYIFFYDEAFSRKIMASYKFQRTGNMYENPTVGCIKDFISSWKYFCLFHDIGYVVEIISNSGNKIPNKKIINTDTFYSSLDKKQIVHQHCLLGSFEILAKTITVDQILRMSSTKLEETSKIFNPYREQDVIVYSSNTGSERMPFSEAMADFFSGENVLIEKMFSNECLKLLLSVFDKSFVSIIGVNKKTGIPTFIAIPKDNTHIVILHSNSQIKELQDII